MSFPDPDQPQPEKIHERLGDAFFDRVSAAAFPTRVLRYRNDRWAKRVGLAGLTDAEWIGHFGAFMPIPGSLAEPLALRYHGHQFRVYNPDLGDGRGFLFAQLRDLSDNRLLDLGTKGSGRTPWSRTADGRLTLKGGVREVLATELLEALGVDTSRSFSLVETGEALMRGDEPSPTRASVLVRLSHSHIRIGSFQRLLYLDAHEDILRLLDHSIEHYLPEARRDDPAERCVAFLEAVTNRVARTGANWMLAGFVHGVLNTDNINVTGESFDYGPWRFLPTLDMTFTAAYFDQNGLYAYGRQPDALLWNLTRLAECFLPFAPKQDLERALLTFEPAFRDAFAEAVMRRLGLARTDVETETRVVGSLWSFLHDSQAPFEQTLFDWYGGTASEDRARRSPAAGMYRGESFETFRRALGSIEKDPRIRLDHPYFERQSPCTMLIDEVEALWEPIAESDDWSGFHARLAQIREMADAYLLRPT